ncbi:MAG TPA: glutathione S-transferase C-terminal domain-containing protein [Solirubrobacteraceae bacterium]
MTAGAFVRKASRFREWPEGGPERHHLYVALACPWSQRTVIVRKVTGLEERLGMSLLDPYRDERGWAFSGGRFSDGRNGFRFLREAYPEDYDGRISVPVLWDTEERRIVNNESADIVRVLAEWAGREDLYPPDLRAEIDALNEWIYADFQNGVYRAGFSRSQEAYDDAFKGVFAALARLDALLSERRYLTGDTITLADWRLLPTLLRFDAVYHTHFRCNGARLIEYEHLLRYTRDLFHQPGVAGTFALDEIKVHYYTTHDELNPKRIIPAGPLDLRFIDPG